MIRLLWVDLLRHDAVDLAVLEVGVAGGLRPADLYRTLVFGGHLDDILLGRTCLGGGGPGGHAFGEVEHGRLLLF